MDNERCIIANLSKGKIGTRKAKKKKPAWLLLTTQFPNGGHGPDQNHRNRTQKILFVMMNFRFLPQMLRSILGARNSEADLICRINTLINVLAGGAGSVAIAGTLLSSRRRIRGCGDHGKRIRVIQSQPLRRD